MSAQVRVSSRAAVVQPSLWMLGSVPNRDKPLEAMFDSLFVFIRCAARSLALGLDLAADMCSPRVRLVEYRRPPCAFVSIWCCVLPLADCQADRKKSFQQSDLICFERRRLLKLRGLLHYVVSCCGCS